MKAVILSSPAADEVRRQMRDMVREEDGRLLVKCHTGCAVEQMVAALGLQMRDALHVRQRRRQGARYPSRFTRNRTTLTRLHA